MVSLGYVCRNLEVATTGVLADSGAVFPSAPPIATGSSVARQVQKRPTARVAARAMVLFLLSSSH